LTETANGIMSWISPDGLEVKRWAVKVVSVRAILQMREAVGKRRRAS
jgi:hypothetical protein